MESRKKNRSVKKNKRFKMSKRTWIILIIFVLILIAITTFAIIYLNSEKYQKNKLEKVLSGWAEEYYTEELVKVASGYIKLKTQKGENININLDALKNFGKNTEIVKNKQTGRTCDDIDTYVSIKVDKDAKDISKEYKIEKVVIDCFE